MNREIKFRAWDKSFEMMYEVDAIRFFDELIEVDNEEDHQTDNINKYEVMQYTGLKDKNGTEIYEGDILRYCGECRNVIYQESSFGWIEDDEYYAFAEMAQSELPKTEVVGNVYENPELLERSE